MTGTSSGNGPVTGHWGPVRSPVRSPGSGPVTGLGYRSPGTGLVTGHLSTVTGPVTGQYCRSPVSTTGHQ
ncbi:hypothetical protein DPMN_028961 [Dreissena polymorpha]|uniref:Uncharacterized protein n=1 Tax=Dreissena polymorpha TaxID=45954 RepID=A0A9D4LY52_DREPO|nr:hypothetical protein DPMN_028961 [Dreissena polymorpha]